MDWKEPYRRLRRYLAGSQPPVTFEEQLAQARAESRRMALGAMSARAERLRPIVDRLLLVTDFGGYAQDEHASRIGEAILADAIFTPDMPIGLSAHVMASRSAHGSVWQAETTFRISRQLEGRSLHVLPATNVVTIANGAAGWLESVVKAAEETAEQAHMPLAQVGHIAVVGSMELAYAGIRDVFTLDQGDNGAAYQLTGVGDENAARFDWTLLSAEMGG